jgi:SAM-dependent methyltransferase
MLFQGHYIQWIPSRMNTIKKYIDNDYFKSKTLLELGCGYGHIGNEFYKLKCDVTCSDARKEHISVVNELYPFIKTELFDCDTNLLSKKYDIIVHWGLLYHLNNNICHLNDVLQNCNVLFLESEVLDSDELICLKTNDLNAPFKEHYQFAFNGIGNLSSPKVIENILILNGFEYKCIIDSMLNTDIHCYDWENKNTGLWKNSQRRFWICWKKNIELPFNCI